MKPIHRHSRFVSPRRRGMTLLELSIVAIILVALTSIALPMFTGVTDSSRVASTNASLRQLQEVILNRYLPDMKGIFPGDTDGLPRPLISGTVGMPQLRYLFVRPATDSIYNYNYVTQRGWNGPYLAAGRATYPDPTSTVNSSRGFDATYGSLSDPTVFDGWGNPIVILVATDGSGTAYLVSAGPNGTLNTNSSTVSTFGYGNTSTSNGDDLGIRLY